jgi:uncharacterized protein (TIGR02147 family)
MKPILSYESYRDLLKDFYEEKKQSNPSYSYRIFSKKAGLNSDNYLKMVMDGQRNITQKNVLKFAKGLNLNEWEARYFENLVFYNQAKDEDDRIFYYKNMELARSHSTRGLLSKDQYEVLSNWHPLAIKELGLLPDFNLNSRWIASKLDHKITPQEAKDAVDLLERLNLIRVDPKSGKIHGTDQSLETPEVDTSSAIGNFHKTILNLASEAIDHQKIDERCLSSLVVAVRKKDLPEAFKKIHKFRNEMDSFFVKGKPYDSVYQLAIQLFRIDNDV